MEKKSNGFHEISVRASTEDCSNLFSINMYSIPYNTVYPQYNVVRKFKTQARFIYHSYIKTFIKIYNCVWFVIFQSIVDILLVDMRATI